MALTRLEHLDKVRDGWLLDTNIISATFGTKPVPDGIAHFFRNVADERLRISVITIGEIRKGIELISSTKNAQTIRFRLTLNRKLNELQERWAERILPVDLAVADRWGAFLGEYQQRGRQLSAVDALIAATAYVHNLAIVSHDVVFSRVEQLSSYDPYTAELR